MQQIWLAMAIAAGVAFGFLVAWVSLRSERTALYAKGKAEAEQERTSLTERLSAKDVRLQEMQREWNQERELLAQLNEENEELRAARIDLDARFAEMQKQAEQKLAAATSAQDKVAEQLKQGWSERLFEQEARLRTVEAELETSRGEVETLRAEAAAAAERIAGAETGIQAEGPGEDIEAARARIAALEQERDTALDQIHSLREDKVRLETTHDALVDKLEDNEVRLAELKTAAETARQEKESFQAEVWRLQAACTESEARLGEARRVMEDQPASVSGIVSGGQLTELVRTASLEAFQANQEAVLAMTQKALEQLQAASEQVVQQVAQTPAATLSPASVVEARLDGTVIEDAVRPLRESLERVDAALHQIDRSRAQDLDNLSSQVKGLMGALRAPAPVPSRWNGMHLRQVVELAGVGKHCEFTASEGPDRTDLAIQLPGSRYLAVDAKAPVGAYLESLRITAEEDRERKLEEHSVSLRAHVENLGLSRGETAPEFTVAFVPNEAFLSSALERQPGLIEEAASRQVFFASPATLIALLKVVSYGWRQQQLADQTRVVRELGQNLYERLCVFTSEMSGVSENLSRTVEGYNRAIGTLENRVMRGARRFADAESSLEPISPSPVNLIAQSPGELQFDGALEPWPVLVPETAGIADAVEPAVEIGAETAPEDQQPEAVETVESAGTAAPVEATAEETAEETATGQVAPQESAEAAPVEDQTAESAGLAELEAAVSEAAETVDEEAVSDGVLKAS